MCMQHIHLVAHIETLDEVMLSSLEFITFASKIAFINSFLTMAHGFYTLVSCKSCHWGVIIHRMPEDHHKIKIQIEKFSY